MMRSTVLACCGTIAVLMSGCLDRGGLNANDDAGSGGATDSGSGTGGAGRGTGGMGTATGGGAGGSNTATGGNTGTGGNLTGTGGSSGTGGRTSTGGSTGTGGVRGTGGTKGSGGSTGTGGNVMCGAICDIYCPYGNVIDARGCPTCQCNPGPVCPAIGCAVACPNGYVKDAKGCDTCMCNPDTKPCTTTECGPAPTAATIVTCASAADGGTAGGGTGSSAGAAPPSDAPAIVAPPAFVCQRGADGKCSWYAGTCRACPAVACTLACANGFQTGTDGCPICACNPPPPSPACATIGDYMTCTANAGCSWLAPGCGEPALAAAGCYAKANLGCTSDAQCGTGHQCLKRIVNPCFNLRCAECAAVQTVCQ